MRIKKRKQRNSYSYGAVIDYRSEMFRWNLYKRIGIERVFRNKKVLDLGCGYGADTINFSKFSSSVVGYDIEQHETWNHIKKKNIKFIRGKSERMPFKDKSFDCVFLKDLLHHVSDVSKTMEEIKRVTKQNGTIVILEANRYNPIFYIYSTLIKGHDHFTQKQFESMVLSHSTNYEILAIEAYPPFKLPERMYKLLLLLEKDINKIKFLKIFFSYNVALIKVH